MMRFAVSCDAAQQRMTHSTPAGGVPRPRAPEQGGGRARVGPGQWPGYRQGLLGTRTRRAWLGPAVASLSSRAGPELDQPGGQGQGQGRGAGQGGQSRGQGQSLKLAEGYST